MSAPRKWGKEPQDLIHELREQLVIVSMVNGKAFKGTLIGANAYNLVIRQQNGLEMIVSKGNMIYMHAASVTE
jgi:sRNA-binding regulator protein Hfq